MSNLIDERIVEMSFDNKNFEKNVKTSMGTIDQLKSSLNFSGVSSSMNKTLSSLDTSGISAGLEVASRKFTAMEIVAISALANITNRVIDLGIEMVKSLSIDNIAAGWEKFGEKTTSVATLVSQGYDMETVTEQLEKLNWFTDETSYSFTDMVSNISKFTAAGQDLETSVAAMMGIANWAALSGQNATTASRAMYQLSQALSSGTVKLADWKSIQNANMDTQEFRQKALDAAVAAGELTQAIDGTYTTKSGNMFDINKFTEYLTSDGWFTSEVLMKTLGDYSSAVDTLYDKVQSDDSISTTSQAIEKYGDELDDFGLKAFRAAQEAKTFRDAIDSVKDAVASGWMNTFEHIFGSYDKAKVLWTDLANELYDVFVEGLNVNNQILKGWSELGGRDDLFVNTEDETGAFWNLFYAIVEIKNLVSRAWDMIFPLSAMEDEADKINDITNKLKSFTAWLKEASQGLYLSEESAEAFTNILKGAFSLLKAFFKIIGAIWTGIKPLVSFVKSLAGQLIGMLSIAGDKFSGFIATTEIFAIAGKKMADILTIIINEIKSFEIINNVVKMIKTMSDSFKKNGGTSENLSRIFAGLKAILGLLLQAFLAVYNFIKTYIFPAFVRLLIFASNLVGAFGGKIIAAFAWIGDLLVMFVNFIRTSKTLNKVFTTVKNGFTSLLTAMKNFFGSFKKVDTSGLDEFNEDVTTKFNPLETILKGLASLFSGLWSVLKSLLPVLSKAMEFVGIILKGFGEKLQSIFGGDGGLTLSKILSMAFLVGIAKSITDVIYLFKGVTNAITDVFGSFSDVLYSKALMQYAEALKTLAIGILILVAALLLIATMDDAQLKRSLAVLLILLGAFALMMVIMKKLTATTKFLGVQSLITAHAMKTTMDAMVQMAIAIAIMAVSIKLLGSMDHDQLMNGLTGLIMIMALMLGAAAIIGKNEKIFKKGARGLISMALAVLILSIPLKKIGSMDPDQLLQGILGISALVGLCTLFAKISGKVKKSVTTAMGMIMFSQALVIASIAMRIIGSMGWAKLAVGITGIVALTGVMVLLGLASKYMKKAILTSFAMLIVGAALIEVAIALLIFGAVKWTSILKAVIALVAVFGALALITKVLNLKMIGAMILLGVALIPLSIGLILLAVAMHALGTLDSKAITQSLKVIGLILGVGGLIMGIVGFLAPTILMFSAAVFVLASALLVLAIAMAAIGSLSWKTLGKSMLVLVVALLALAIAGTTLKPVVGVIMKVALSMLMMAAAVLIISVALAILIVTLGLFGTSLATTLKMLSAAIIEAAPMMALAIGALLSAIFQGLTMAIGELFVLLDVLIIQILEFLWKHGPRIIETVVMLLAELLRAIAEYFPSMMASIMSMVITLLEALRDNISTIIDIVIDILLNLIKALTERLPEIIAAIVEMGMTIIESLVKAIVDMIPRLIQAGFDLLLGIISGLGKSLKDNAAKVRTTMIQFANDVIDAFLIAFGMKSPNDQNGSTFGSIGKNLIEGLFNGIKNIGSTIWEGIKKVGNGIVDGFKNFFGIKSPSRVFAELGMFLDQGLAKGLDDNSDVVYDSVDSLGHDVIDGFENSGVLTAVQKLYDSLGSEIDNELTIKPVMDLTEIQNGTNKIFGMMENIDGYEINGSNDIANKTAYSVRNNKKDNLEERINQRSNLNKMEPQQNFYNTFTITDAVNPKEVAKEVSEIMQTQIFRSKAKYGKSNI